MSLSPLYTSLAIPLDSFGDGQQPATERPPFSAVMAAGTAFPNEIWLFKGEDVYRFNVRAGKFAPEVQPMRSVFGDRWPMSFAAGIDSATWAGPSFPDLHYAFVGSQFIRWHASTSEVEGPMDIAASGWWSTQDGFFKEGCDVALHDVRPQMLGMLHIFRGDQYLRHDMGTARNVAGPGPIAEFWKLPKPFCDRIDLAFYGAGGENATKIYFVHGNKSVLYDLLTDTCDASQPIDRRLPVFAEHIPAPQLFLREQYNLNTYVTDPAEGRLIGTVNTGALTKETVRVVTEVVETTTSKTTQSVLASTEQATLKNLHDEIRRHSEDTGSTESDRYSFDAAFHGEAGATSPWSGDADADVHARGGSDNVRAAFGEAVDKSIAKQVTDSSRRLQQSVTNAEVGTERKERVLHEQVQVIDNSGNDQVVSTGFYQLMDRYVTLLVLKQADLVFANGLGKQQVANLADTDRLLSEHLPDEAIRRQARSVVVANVTAIRDATGQARSLLRAGSDSAAAPIQPEAGVRSTYEMIRPDGTTQAVSVQGIIIHAKEHLAPSSSVIARRI